MLTTYKVDMTAALEHMARMEGLPTSYEDSSDATCVKKNKAAQRSRSNLSYMIWKTFCVGYAKSFLGKHYGVGVYILMQAFPCI